MTLEEYKEIDTTFNQAIFIGNVNRMIYNIYDNISSNQLEKIKHYMNDHVYNKIENIVKNNQKEGQTLHYSNIFIDSEIRGFEILNGNIVIKVNASCNFSKYYQVDGNTVSGSATDSIQVLHTFYFAKNNTYMPYYRCSSCGFSYDFKETNKCPKCGNTNTNKKEDYFIVGMV